MLSTTSISRRSVIIGGGVTGLAAVTTSACSGGESAAPGGAADTGPLQFFLSGDANQSGGFAAMAARYLAGLADACGLFASDGNLSSPSDSGFSLNDLGSALALLRVRGGGDPALGRLEEQQLTGIATRALPLMVGGGVHTPNHHWEVAAALARHPHPHPGPRGRAEEWLAEGVDADADGIYSGRSANYAAHVSNPCLLVLAERLGRPELADVVHRNLHTVLDLTDDDGLVETVLSRRQDQHAGYPVRVLHLQLRRFALLHGCGVCAAAAAPPERWVSAPVAGAEALAAALLEPRLGDDVPGTTAVPAPEGRRVLAGPGLVVERRAGVRTVVYGGSDERRWGGCARARRSTRRCCGSGPDGPCSARSGCRGGSPGSAPSAGRWPRSPPTGRWCWRRSSGPPTPRRCRPARGGRTGCARCPSRVATPQPWPSPSAPATRSSCPPGSRWPGWVTCSGSAGRWRGPRPPGPWSCAST